MLSLVIIVLVLLKLPASCPSSKFTSPQSGVLSKCPCPILKTAVLRVIPERSVLHDGRLDDMLHSS